MRNQVAWYCLRGEGQQSLTQGLTQGIKWEPTAIELQSPQSAHAAQPAGTSGGGFLHKRESVRRGK